MATITIDIPNGKVDTLLDGFELYEQRPEGMSKVDHAYACLKRWLRDVYRMGRIQDAQAQATQVIDTAVEASEQESGEITVT